MSQENVEIVRRNTDAYNRGDLDGILENWAPDAVVDWSSSRGFDAGVFRGHSEIKAHWQRLFEAFDEVRVDLVDPIEVEDGLLIVENVGYFEDETGSKSRLEARGWSRIRDGELTAFTLYQTKQEALEAVRLRD